MRFPYYISNTWMHALHSDLKLPFSYIQDNDEPAFYKDPLWRVFFENHHVEKKISVQL